MLDRLVIKNIALIDKLNIELCGGMNVLSGETGTGKSIIVDSVNLVLGERADRELIRTGEENAAVEAWFNEVPKSVNEILDGQQIDTGDGLVLSRELSASGKNVCRINGSLVTLAVLKAVSDLLVDVHGQHEHQSLFNEKKHLGMLDTFDNRIYPVMEEVVAVYGEYTAVIKRLRSLFGADGDRERRIDMLKFQINEIQQAGIAKGEEEDLIVRKKRLNAAEEITSALGAAYDTLYEAEPLNVLAALKDIRNRLSGLGHVDKRYEEMAAVIDESYYTLEEITEKIRDDIDESGFDADSLEEIESKLSMISGLKRKYGDPCIGGDYIVKAEQELQDLIDSENLLSELTEKAGALKEKLYSKSVELSNIRREAAKLFETRMLEQLRDLGMASASFSVNFDDIHSIDECTFSSRGIDTAEFYISTNRGEPEKPLRKVASGGEISRIMLALKNIAADRGDIPTMIFDEIDTGISGHMAQVVAEKLKTISKSRQVICVTHLPQIASMADKHFIVTKKSDDKTTRTYLNDLRGENRVQEIARLSGGDSELARNHAREMLEKANKFKTTI